MKRLFTLAIMAMIASLTFAQAPLAKKATKKNEVVNIHAIEKKMNEAKAFKAAQAEKAAAAQVTSTSVLRRSVKDNAAEMSMFGGGKVLEGVKFNSTRTVVPGVKGHKSAKAAKATTVKGQMLFGHEVSLNPLKTLALQNNLMAAPAQRITTQEGNVTVTTENGVITDVVGVEPKAYTRGETGTTYFISNQQLVYTAQSGAVMVVEDGNNVYIKDPLARFAMGSWVKGTKEDNTISIANMQPLLFNANYNAAICLGWGNVSDLKYATDKATDAITFSVDGDVLTLEGTSSPLTSEEGYVIGAYWNDDLTYQGCWDAETVLTYDSEYVAPSTELVTVPEGTEIATWYLNGESSEDDIVNKEVLVGANEDMEFYVQGLCTNFPEAWVKGTYNEETGLVTFASGQYVGDYGPYNIWFAGTSDWETLCDVTATYDAEASTLTFNEDILENANVDEPYCLEYYSNMVLSMEKKGGNNNPGGEVTVTTDVNGIITSVTGGTAKYYQRSNDGTAYYASSGSMVFDAQSGIVTTIEDGDDVYIKDPICKYTQNSWVKGTKADGKIIIPAKQPLAYNANYDATISLRWGLINAEGNIEAVDDHADAFTFTIDGDKLILEGTKGYTSGEDCYYMGAFWDDDNSATGYGDAETVLVLDNEYVAPTTEPVVVPATAEVAEWYMNGNQLSSSSTTAVKNRVIKVAADELDVYVQGLSADFPESWVKGTLDDETGIITFAKNQWMGFENNYGLDIWFLGYDTTVGDICDPTAVYDYEAGTITFKEQVVINGATDRLYYLERYDDVVLSMEEKEYVEPTITDLTAELPYLNTFETEAEQAEVAIYDANEDGSTFEVLQETEENFGARYSYSSSNTGNDYLVFPGVKLEAGKTYKVSVDARSISSYYSERFEVVVGTEAKASKLTTEVIPATDVESTEYATFKNEEFTVEEDGTYFFAVHAISDPDQYRLWIDNFSVSELDPLSPVVIEDLAVVASEDGDNEAFITFTAPTLNIGGDALEGDVKVAITCNGEKVKNLLVEPGEEVELIHKVAAPGTYTFVVVASQGTHVSDAAKVKAYIGEDTPDRVENLVAVDNGDGTVGLTWEAPTTGLNDGVIIPANLKYNVYPVEMFEILPGWTFPETDYENPYVTGLTETNATVEFDTNVGVQEYSYISVNAENAVGESDDNYASILTGAPYTLPFIETLPGNLTYWWSGDVDDDNYELDGGVVATPTTEDENGDLAFLFDAKTAGWMELYSGKIALSGKAALSFDYSATAKVRTLKLYVSAPGKENVLVNVVEPWLAPTDETGAEIEKATVQVSLAEFVNEPWVRLTWRAEFDGEAELLIDNISIIGFDNELVAKAITAPAKAEANTEFNVTVTVANEGANAAEGYTVELYKNGEKVAEQAGEAIASAAKATVVFAQTLGITEKEAEYKAVIVYDVDENEANNETETVTVTVKLPKYPVVEDLAGSVTSEGVQLTWSEPNLEAGAPEAITETFENAEPFALTVDGWTLVDEDGGKMGGIEGIDLGVASGAWFVFDNSGDAFNESFVSHSGNKFMSTMYNTDSANSDWMISPALYGGAQTISIWATSYTDRYGLEKMEVLYSTTDKELASFESLGVVEVPAEWTEYTYDLPEGAKYFAIRYVSSDVFMLWVDDVTYIPAEGASVNLALVGYNVYRDGVKVNEAPVAETTYVDTEATAGEHTYVVTVVYEQGESAPSNEVTVGVTTGISEINADANANGNVYSVSGAMIRKGTESLNGLAKGVYIINGKKVVRK